MTTTNDISKANVTFALNLFKKLADESQAADVFFSSFSISAALAMVMLGARGNTAAQMSQVLGFTESDKPQPVEEAQPDDAAQPEEGAEAEVPQLEQTVQTPARTLFQSQTRNKYREQMQQQRTISRLPPYLLRCLTPSDGKDDVHAGFAKLLSEFNKPHADYALLIANRLYGEQSYEFLQQFLDETRKHYKAELESVDFKENVEAALLKINTWVEEQTQGKIKDLITKDVVDESTKMVLVNAIYFKGKWQQQFKEEDTVDAPFRISKNDSRQVKMMRQKSKFSFAYHPDVKLKVLELPYEGENISMIILLPDEIEDDTTGLEKLEKTLTYETFEEWTRSEVFVRSEVKVALPRFSLAETYKLKEVLISLGMKNAFDVAMSDLTGMSSRNDLVLSQVVHKAYVDVNEEGTQAAAATGAVVNVRSAMITETFNADHPFLFFIRHNTSRNILFAGRYCSPA